MANPKSFFQRFFVNIASFYKKHYFIYSLIIIALSVLVAALNTALQITVYQISSPKLTGNIRAAIISDLHSSGYGDGQKSLLNALKQINPDLVFLTGDIFDDKISPENTQVLLEVIGPEYRCYYISGNHDVWSGNVRGFKEFVANCNIAVLDGKSDLIEINGQKINICGVDDPDIIVYENNVLSFAEQMALVSSSIDSTAYNILLSHRPERVNDYENYNFDLIVSGHAHGGQWRMPFFDVSVYAPNQGLFPPYTSGVYHLQGSTMVVSRGLDKDSIKIPRLFNRPEIVVLDLKGDND